MIFSARWLVLLILISSFVVANETETHLQQLTDRLLTGDAISGFEDPIQARSMVADFYRLREYKPAWEDDKFSESVLKAISESVHEGLLPDDYHYGELMKIHHNNDHKKAGYLQAQFELLMTDAVILYAFHLIHGKTDPENMESTWNYVRKAPLPKEAIASLEKHVEEKTVVERLNELKPDIQLYKLMREGLAFYRLLEQTQPFVKITNTPLLRSGVKSTVIPQVRQRLTSLNLLDKADTVTDIYDEPLVNAVKEFQQLHAMNDDGVIGKQTWAALNLSWQERIDKLRINLERTRWVHGNISDKFAVVNIAGFTLYLIENRKVIWRTAVMTGTVKNETPLFTSRFSYMEINPTWTVPRSILRNSLINKMKNDPQYLVDNDFVLYDRKGELVDVNLLDWSTLNPNNFPFTAVQQPGKLNALGQVKFIFPNSYSIYLHDTPARSLFSKSSRAFSYGCVRVEHPFEFARLLMDDPDKWSASNFETVLASKKRTRITIKKPVDVMLMYWTTEPFNDNKIRFNPDIYNRDAGVLAALNKPL